MNIYVDFIKKICNGSFEKFKCLYPSDQRFWLEAIKYCIENKKGKYELALKLNKNLLPFKSSFAWENKEFPVYKENVNFLCTQDGHIIKDACIWENFLQEEFKIDPDTLWKNLQKYKKHNSKEKIKFNKKGNDPMWVMGDYPSLHYRGNALKRHKMWLQKDYEKGFKKYGYTGWQHTISYASRDIKYVKEVNKISKQINKLITSKKLNHWILTMYKDGEDYIGYHSDKINDFYPDSYFIVIKLGDPRKFEFRLKSDTKENKPFFSKILKAGTAIFVRVNCNDIDANSITQHSVPPMDKKSVGSSGSIVGRAIKTTIDWNTVHRNIKKSEESKEKRKLLKLKKIS